MQGYDMHQAYIALVAATATAVVIVLFVVLVLVRRDLREARARGPGAYRATRRELLATVAAIWAVVAAVVVFGVGI